MFQELVIQVSKLNGWSYDQEGDTLRVFDNNLPLEKRGEPALIVKGNRVVHNRWEAVGSENQLELIRQMLFSFYPQYGSLAVYQAFSSENFDIYDDQGQPYRPFSKLRENIGQKAYQKKRSIRKKFLTKASVHPKVRAQLNEEQARGRTWEHLVILGRTADPHETDKSTRIDFWVLQDGTLISDSNYIPRDLHDRADAAMEQLDAWYGTSRIEGTDIRRKEIPVEYKEKAFCKPKAATEMSW